MSGGMPLTAAEVSLMLRSGYSNNAILHDLLLRHFGDNLDPASERQLIQAGANQLLIDALRSDRYRASASELAVVQQKLTTRVQTAGRPVEQTTSPQGIAQDGGGKSSQQTGAPDTIYRLLRGELVYWHEGALNPFDDEVLESKKLYLFFFSAFGSAQGRKFTLQLIDYYNRVAPTHPEFEVIFFSTDRSQFAMETYINQANMPWPAVAYDKLASKGEIIRNLVRSVPCLVLINATGDVLSRSGGGTNEPGPEKVLMDLDKIFAGRLSLESQNR
jgi:hypothetical protein